MHYQDRCLLQDAAADLAASIRACLINLSGSAACARKFADNPPAGYKSDFLDPLEKEAAVARFHLRNLLFPFEAVLKVLGRFEHLEIVRRLERLPYPSFDAQDGGFGVNVEEIDRFLKEVRDLYDALFGLEV